MFENKTFKELVEIIKVKEEKINELENEKSIKNRKFLKFDADLFRILLENDFILINERCNFLISSESDYENLTIPFHVIAGFWHCKDKNNTYLSEIDIEHYLFKHKQEERIRLNIK